MVYFFAPDFPELQRRGCFSANTSICSCSFEGPPLFQGPNTHQRLTNPDANTQDVLTVEDVQEGDLVFLATDGVFDNVFDEDILEIVGDLGLSIQNRATKIAMLAFKNSLDYDYPSPFAAKEMEYYIERLPKGASPPRIPIVGGKSDDISVVLACVKEAD